ncbi:MAG: Ig-like domain-containing protein [Muribaculaceae bacterium]|nr:Ig-like domain-containing protein [Muribaculaceae bacterium]
MKPKLYIHLLLMIFGMLTGAFQKTSAAERFYIDDINIEPDETATLIFKLESDNLYYGFQADMLLPTGLEFVLNNGKPDIELSLTDPNHNITVVSNLISENTLRFGTFSTGHTPINGTGDSLFSIKVKSSPDFEGGELKMTDILFVNRNDEEVSFPSISKLIGTHHNDRVLIPNFNIPVGESMEISLDLNNESVFTAFQVDIIPPKGLDFNTDSFKLTSRATDHSLSVKKFDDGHVRVICFSINNTPITGIDGAILNMVCTANHDIPKSAELQLKNPIFTTSSAHEYILENSTTSITTDRIYVTSITIIPSETSLMVDETIYVEAIVSPENATTKSVKWSSSNPEIARVSQTGIVTGIYPGDVTVTATAIDGSNISAECNITVKGIPVQEIILNSLSVQLEADETFELLATVWPVNAHDKSLGWCSLDESVAVVDNSGIVTAVNRGTAVIRVFSLAYPDVFADCQITVTPKPVVSELIWNQNFRYMIGESVRLEAYSSEGYPLEYSCITPDGGFCIADIEHVNGDEWTATFNYEGAYILRVSDGEKEMEKRFNVLSSHDGLMEIEGLYYRYADDNHNTLKVVRGYNMYEGDYIIPTTVNGLQVVSIDDMAFYSCKFLNDVMIEDGIETLGGQSFGNSSLHAIDIPASVRTLSGNYVFNALNGNLSSISFHGLPPAADETTFNGFVDYERCVLHIPAGTYPLYREAPIWGNFVEIIDDLPQYVHLNITDDYLEIEIGKEYTLNADVTPEYASSLLRWRSNDDSIATVNQEGVVTGVSKGTTEIIAYIGDIIDIVSVKVDNLSGIATPSVDEMRIVVTDRCIKVSDNGASAHIRLFDINGVVISETFADGTSISFDNLLSGLYILCIGDNRFKIVLP